MLRNLLLISCIMLGVSSSLSASSSAKFKDESYDDEPYEDDDLDTNNSGMSEQTKNNLFIGGGLTAITASLGAAYLYSNTKPLANTATDVVQSTTTSSRRVIKDGVKKAWDVSSTAVSTAATGTWAGLSSLWNNHESASLWLFGAGLGGLILQYGSPYLPASLAFLYGLPLFPSLMVIGGLTSKNVRLVMYNVVTGRIFTTPSPAENLNEAIVRSAIEEARARAARRR